MSDLVRFEERKIQPFAESVAGEDLKYGEVYFFVHYTDDDLLSPIVRTVIFIGRNLEPRDRHLVYFQDAQSYRKGVRYDSDEPARVFSTDENETSDVFEYERALDRLLLCDLRRQEFEQGGTAPVARRPSETTEAELQEDRAMVLARFSEFIAARPDLKDEELDSIVRDLSPRRFRSRDISPQPEPIPVQQIQEGPIYFLLEYIDDERLIPAMETVAFIGRNLESKDRGRLYFQDIESYLNGLRYGSTDSEDCARFRSRSEASINDLFDYEHVLEEWMRCSLRRRKNE